MEKRRTTGPRIGPRITAPQPAPPPTYVQIGNDRALPGAREVDIAQIRPDPDQPRRSMDPGRLEELAASIRQHGLLQPLVVRQEGLGPDGDMRYVIIAGGRRYAALTSLVERAPDETVRARFRRVMVVVNESEAAERRILQLIENVQREDLSPVEEARVLKEIMHVEGLSTIQLAKRVHRSQGYVDERLRLLRHEAIEAAVEAGTLTKSAGAAIASLPSAAARDAWLARAEAGETIRPREVYASKSPAPLQQVGADTRKLQQDSGIPEATLPKFGSADASTPNVAPPKTAAIHASAFNTAARAQIDAEAIHTLDVVTDALGHLSLPATQRGRAQLEQALTRTRGAIDRLLNVLHELDRASIAARSDDSE